MDVRALAANSISAVAIAAAALNGKGDWNIGKTGYALTSAEEALIATAILTAANGIETGWTLQQALRIVLSSLGGKLSGAPAGPIVVRDAGDSKARITATVDADGNLYTIEYAKAVNYDTQWILGLMEKA